MNITDVGHLTSDADEGEDKMLKGAQREGKTVWEVAKFYENAFFNDTKRLNILAPDVVCRATEHIKEMIALIARIEKNGYTYAAGGNVYFDVSKFKNYAELARLNLDEAKKARVEADKLKKNPADFVLWFTKSKFSNQEMKWDSPWGEGYPGWHIECSAMSMKYLGEQFDIHCGGIDHIPVHHTNEIAQSEAATGKHPWVKYWMHNEFIVMDKGKMAKSSGDFLTLQKLIDSGYEPVVYRYFVLGAHYRQQLKFSFEGLEGARITYKRLRQHVIDLKEVLRNSTHYGLIEEMVSSLRICEDQKITSRRQETPFSAYLSKSSPSISNCIVSVVSNSFEEKSFEYVISFKKAMNDDLNTPEALAVTWSVLRDEELDPKDKLSLLYFFDEILGLGFRDFGEQKIEIPDEVLKLKEERDQARFNKNWDRSDQLRDMIKSHNYTVKDTSTGSVLEKNS